MWGADARLACHPYSNGLGQTRADTRRCVLLSTKSICTPKLTDQVLDARRQRLVNNFIPSQPRTTRAQPGRHSDRVPTLPHGAIKFPMELAPRLGWASKIAEIAPKLHCSKCNSREVNLYEARR